MLHPDELNRLVDLVAALYDFTDAGPRGRRLLLTQANLGRFLGGLDLSGSPRIVAAAILTQIENYGYLPDQPTIHALGALLSYLLTLGDLPADQKTFLASLIVKYSLVTDPIYIKKIGEDYSVNTTVERKPDAANTAPPITNQIEASPSFKIDLKDPTGLESIINSEDNFLDVSWLFGALYSAQAVCRIEVPEDTAKGTGFLIGPDLVLTNAHVLKNLEYVKDAVLRFDYRADALGTVPNQGRLFRLVPDFYFFSPAELLDYALVRVQGRPLEQVITQEKGLSPMDLVLKGKHRGYLVTKTDYVREHDRVNIIQHPDGDPMKVVMTQNYVIGDMANTRVHYVADTMGGSSGSPVFNRKWEVVALHHSGAPYPPESVDPKKGWKGQFRVNQGIPMRDILKDFQTRDLERYLPSS